MLDRLVRRVSVEFIGALQENTEALYNWFEATERTCVGDECSRHGQGRALPGAVT